MSPQFHNEFVAPQHEMLTVVYNTSAWIWSPVQAAAQRCFSCCTANLSLFRYSQLLHKKGVFKKTTQQLAKCWLSQLKIWLSPGGGRARLARSSAVIISDNALVPIQVKLLRPGNQPTALLDCTQPSLSATFSCSAVSAHKKWVFCCSKRKICFCNSTEWLFQFSEDYLLKWGQIILSLSVCVNF